MRLLQRKLAIGFGAMVLVLVLVTAGAAWEAARFRAAYASMRETYDVFVRLDQALTSMLSMEASVRGFALTGEDAALRPYEAAAPQLDECLQDLRRLAAIQPHLRAQLDQLEPLAAQVKQSMSVRIAARRDRGFDGATQAALTAGSQRALADYWRVVREMAQDQRRAINDRLRHAYDAARITLYGVIAASVLAIASVVVAGARMRRDLRRRHEAEAALKESFARVEDLYNKAPCGYHSLDQHGTVVAMNDTALDWLGYTRDEVMGRMNFADLLTPASAAIFRERFAVFRQTGAVHNVEYEWRRKNGTTLPILLNATAIYDAQGNYVASRATVFDITARKHAQDERDRFFNVARDLLCIANFEARFIRLNPAWERTLGFTLDELLGRPATEFVHPDDRERTAAEAARLAAGEETIEFENRYRTKDGDYRWLRWNARAVAAERLIYASARDVTESREAEKRIHDLNVDLAARAQQLEAANRELESFSYSVSHDLRAPLRHIDGFASLLTRHAEQALDPEGRRYLDIISKAAKQMGALIDDLLAFSRIGRAPLRHERLNHSQLLSSVITNGRFDTHPQITWEIGSLPDVHADAAMLRQVWANLIDNAVKYSSKNPQPRITIGGQKAQGDAEYVFFVRDNGVGFDMAYADKLFGVFQRLHGPAEFEGTGIGLANVRRIISRHGGRTWAEARVGEGAVFYFSLPNHDSAGSSS